MRWHRALTDFTAAAAAVGVGVMAVAYCAEVVARYLLGSPLNWSGDLSSYLLCACGFLALPKVTGDGAHIAVTFLVERASGAKRARYENAVRMLTGLVCTAVACIIGIEGLRLFNEHVLTSNANQIPKWWLAAFAFYGLSSAALHLFEGRRRPHSDTNA